MEAGTDLYRLADGTMIPISYQDEIPGPIVRTYSDAVGPGFLMVHDNASCVRVCRHFLEDYIIDTTD